jgi:hypothetical protein
VMRHCRSMAAEPAVRDVRYVNPVGRSIASRLFGHEVRNAIL